MPVDQTTHRRREKHPFRGRSFTRCLHACVAAVIVSILAPDTAVQDVPYATLRERLLAVGATLSGDAAPKKRSGGQGDGGLP
jgi:hypothetical protein